MASTYSQTRCTNDVVLRTTLYYCTSTAAGHAHSPPGARRIGYARELWVADHVVAQSLCGEVKERVRGVACLYELGTEDTGTPILHLS